MAVAYNLTNLPDPHAIEELNFQTILNELLADFKLRNPSYTNTGLGDPVYTQSHVSTVREEQIRERVNAAVRACMVSHAVGSDLDNLAANFGVFRLEVQTADPSADPPKPQILETDDKLRERMILAWEQLAPGSPGWYKNHVLKADQDVFDVITKPGTTPGTVEIWVQSYSNAGVPPDSVIDAVEDYMYANDQNNPNNNRRMLNDTISVHKVRPVIYNITADLTIAPGPLASDIETLVRQQVVKFCDESRRIGRSIPLSAIYAVLNQNYVESVNLIAPSTNVVLNSLTAKGVDVQIPQCGTITLTTA